ncbi:hypothetical protein [Clostridium sp. UBA1652]|uniref:hypothetical protein n=1 Tax=Clostridium sp. UBA1652 TaxID=1946348 RepID=UPI00257CA7A1|nr:hypothetical protein [Clostridium sp. UBA1652]
MLKKFTIIGLIFCIVFIVLTLISPKKFNGKWYLYNGNDINTESNISNQLNSKDYIEISKGTMKTFKDNGKNGISELKISGGKMYVGDAIYKYDINKIEEHKILFLELIGYDNGHIKDFIENGEEYIYVFEEDIN